MCSITVPIKFFPYNKRGIFRTRVAWCGVLFQQSCRVTRECRFVGHPMKSISHASRLVFRESKWKDLLHAYSPKSVASISSLSSLKNTGKRGGEMNTPNCCMLQSVSEGLITTIQVARLDGLYDNITSNRSRAQEVIPVSHLRIHYSIPRRYQVLHVTEACCLTFLVYTAIYFDMNHTRDEND